MSAAAACLAAFLAVELAALQRTLGNREHSVMCLIAAAAIIASAALDHWTGRAG